MENENTDTEGGGIKTGANSKGTTGRKLLPAARYLASIEMVEKTLAKSSGNPRLSFTFRVAAGEFQGKKLFDDVYLTEEALWKLDAICDAVGIEKGTDINPNDPAALINLFSGKQLFVTLGVDDYKDKNGNEREGRKIVAFDTTEATKPPERRDAKTGGDEAGGEAGGDEAGGEAGGEAASPA